MLDTFEEFLEEKCNQEESDIINKDNCEAVADKWFAKLHIQDLIDFGDDYAKYVVYKTLSDIGDKITIQTLKAYDELHKK